MTTADIPLANGVPTDTVTVDEVVGGQKTKRFLAAKRAVDAAERGAATVFGDLRGAWVWKAGPPPLREVVRLRVAEWPVFEKIEHRCHHRDGKVDYEIANGWACACSDVTDEERRRNTTQVRIYKVWRHGWTAYNHVVAVPVTAVGYLLIWILQHPARALLAGSLALLFIAVVFG